MRSKMTKILLAAALSSSVAMAATTGKTVLKRINCTADNSPSAICIENPNPYNVSYNAMGGTGVIAAANANATTTTVIESNTYYSSIPVYLNGNYAGSFPNKSNLVLDGQMKLHLK